MNPCLPRDRALPRLALALDAGAMSDVFATALAGQARTVDACRIERIKYRPGRNCMVSYLLHLRDERSGALLAQRVAGRLCSGGDSARRARKAAAGSWVTSTAGPALVHFDGLDMLTWWWPNDAKLEAPRLLADDVRVRASVLPEVVAAATAGRGELVAHHVEFVQYVPEHRLCARARLRWRAGASGTAAGAATEALVYAKANRESGGAAAHALHRAIEASAEWRSGRLRTPRSLLWQPATGLHWQEALPGCALADAQPAQDAALSAAVGMQLAALHAIAAPIERRCTARDLAQRPHEVADVLGQVQPDWQPQLVRLAERLAAGAPAIAALRPATLHGDLHPRNVLVHDGELALIDLDGARRGPGVLDLGAWIADALYRALLAGLDPQCAAPAWQAFLAGHAAGGGETPDEAHLAWATAYQLVCQRAWRCVVNLKPGRFALTPRLLALAETILAARSPLAAAARPADASTARAAQREFA